MQNETHLFLPTSMEEAKRRGWESIDIILICGDAYIDHPSFGTAIISRLLEKNGYKVGIISQPDYNDDSAFSIFGKPNLFFGISSGSMDSMIKHYTAQKKIRSQDAYSPNGKIGLRPDRATLIYSQIIKRIYKGVPIVLGGIEASLRRIPHYDFWSDKLKNSILLDSKADVLIYGMGELSILKIAEQYKTRNIDFSQINGIVYSESTKNFKDKINFIFDEIKKKEVYGKFFHSFIYEYKNKDFTIKSGSKILIHKKPSLPLTTEEMDKIYDLPFQRKPHPQYSNAKILAFEQIKLSITSHRGCLGGCNFCAIGNHQGKTIQSRSKESIKKELSLITKQSYFKGTISDVGGPSANNYKMKCKKNISTTCKKTSCIYPEICKNLDHNHKPYLSLLKELNNHKSVRHLFIASGIRFDLIVDNKNAIKEIAQNYTGGLLKVAPEHLSENVLKKMGKPSFKIYEKFTQQFKDISEQLNKNQHIVPYIIVGHPGAILSDTLEMALYLKNKNIKLKQIQEFTPTPMTISTCMYFTEEDFTTFDKIHVPKGREIRQMKSLIQWFNPNSKKYVIEALKKLKKQHLIKTFYPQKKTDY